MAEIQWCLTRYATRLAIKLRHLTILRCQKMKWVRRFALYVLSKGSISKLIKDDTSSITERVTQVLYQSHGMTRESCKCSICRDLTLSKELERELNGRSRQIRLSYMMIGLFTMTSLLFLILLTSGEVVLSGWWRT